MHGTLSDIRSVMESVPVALAKASRRKALKRQMMSWWAKNLTFPGPTKMVAIGGLKNDLLLCGQCCFINRVYPPDRCAEQWRMVGLKQSVWSAQVW